MNTVLLVDNDADFLATYTELLENAGYQVLSAQTLDQARQLLATARTHLAILDIRMVNDDDEKDLSGLALAKQNEYRSIPKIVLTGFATTDKVRGALRPVLDGLPPAVDFLAKQEGQEAMLDAVEQAFAQHVRINWTLCIRWTEDQPLSFPGLASLIEKNLSLDCLVDQASEIEDLFRKLFYDYDQVTLARLLWQKEAHVALQVFTYSQEREDQFVVTCGRIQQVRAEEESYTQVARQVSGAGGTVKGCTAETLHFAAIGWIMSGTDTEELKSFAAFFQDRDRRDKQIRSVIEHLFQVTLDPWQKQGRFSEESMSLPQLFRKRLNLTEEAFLPAEFARRMQTLCEAARARSIVAQVAWPSRQLVIQFSRGEPTARPDPTQCLFDDNLFITSPVECWMTSVNLDVDTILVDRAGQTWLTDLAPAGTIPIWYNFVQIEGAIRFKLMEVGDLETLYVFEKQLLLVDRLSTVIPPGDMEPGHLKALGAIQAIRRQASEITGDDPGPYYTGLFFCALEDLLTYNPAVKYTKSEIARLLHRLLLMAMLCEKINRMKDNGSGQTVPFSSGGLLHIDGTNRDVLVGERHCDLSAREFDLLLYLYRHAGALCTRVDIGREVFGLKDPDRHERDGLINTNIGRLRQEIEENPTNPRYIITVRGQGFKLIVDPK